MFLIGLYSQPQEDGLPRQACTERACPSKATAGSLLALLFTETGPS